MFGSGFLGGFGHCVGMCGPVVATYSLTLKPRSIAPHLLYNLGRISTYAILGGFIGLTGSFTGIVGSVERFQNIALALTGVVMVLMALSVGGWVPSLKSGEERTARRFLGRAVTAIAGTRSTGAYFPMGLVLGFLPCGLLYTALIGAAGAGMEAGSPAKGFLRGMLLLALFGLGTAPAMLLLGRIVSLKSEWLRTRLYRGAAVLMTAMGILFIYRSLK